MELMRVKRLTLTAILPAYQTAGAAGLDLHADLAGEELCLYEGQTVLISSSIAVQLPPGHVGLVRGRSSMAKRGIHCFDGSIDEDYTGPVGILLSGNGHRIKHGDRIAQLLVVPVARCEVVEVNALAETERGSSGWGSTGL